MITKLRILWNVLRGQPTIYRVRFGNTIEVEDYQGLIVAECTVSFHSEPAGVSQLEARAAGVPHPFRENRKEDD